MNNLVPDGWYKTKIGDVLEIVNDRYEMKDEEHYPLLSVRRRNGGFFNREMLQGKNILTKTLSKAIPESFVISKMQVVHGACGIITEPFYNGFLSASYVSFLSKNNKTHLPYFNYLCHMPEMIKLFLLSSHGVHIEKMTFDIKDWLSREIVIPPLPEQKRIAKTLTSVDEVIEKTQAQIDKLKDLKTGMMQELLTRGVGVDGKPHTEFKEIPKWTTGRIADLKEIPSSWELVNINDVAKLESGHTPSRDKPEYWGGSFQWVSLHDTKQLHTPIINKTKLTITQSGLDNSSARLLPIGTIAFSRTASVGHCVMFGEKMATSQDFANYVCGDKLSPRYVLQLFRWMQHVWSQLAEGSTHKTIYMPVFKKLHILLPPLNEQVLIADIAESIDKKILMISDKLEANKKLKKALMQDLLTGKVRVKVDS